MRSSFIVIQLIIIGVNSSALDCYQSVNGNAQTVQDAQLGLSIASSVFNLASTWAGGLVSAGLGTIAEGIDASNFIVGYYGDSISDDESIWKCLDKYLQEIISEIYQQVASFEAQSAKEIVNDLLKPVNNLAVNYDGNDNKLVNNLCGIIQAYMNQQSLANWYLCDNLGDVDCNKDLNIQYYYLALPYLVQYINLRFDAISWLYNTSNIIECEVDSSIQSNYDATFELYAFYQDTRDLFSKYLATLPYLIHDVNRNSGLDYAKRVNYYKTNYGSPSVLCRWFDTAFAIFENTIDYEGNELTNGSSVITFDLKWSNFVGKDFSMFARDCDSALISWLMLASESIDVDDSCTKSDIWRTAAGTKMIHSPLQCDASITTPAPTDCSHSLNIHVISILYISYVLSCFV